jgi:hypothetical protein
MQQQLSDTYPELQIRILGVNERGHEIGNPTVTEGRTIPWLQDVDEDQDGASDNFMNLWDYAYRDVVIVDAQNVPLEAYNLTEHDLGQPENFNELLQKLVDAAQSVEAPSWTNPVEPLDVNNDTFVSPLDSLLIINELNGLGARELEPPGGENIPPPYLDPSGDGFISPMDALLVINRLNETNSVQSAVAAVSAAKSTSIELSTNAAPQSETDTRTFLLAAAVDEIFFDHDDDRGFKRRVLSEDATVGARP